MKGKHIVVGVTGSVAAFKACALVRALREEGAELRVVQTKNATRFVGTASFHALSGHPVLTDLWATEQSPSGEPHIDLSSWADAILVYPASQAFVGRIAACQGDDLLALTVLSADCPVLLAPAMHHRMNAHPLFRDAVERVEQAGLQVLPTVEGRLANGDEGMGRLLEPATALEYLAARCARQDLAGIRLVVTAGPTREYLDLVRYLSNPSTGRMGLALARRASRRGARVHLILGPTTEALDFPVETLERVESAAQMHAAVKAATVDADALLMAAAVADFRPKTRHEEKLRKSVGPPNWDLEPTTDILEDTLTQEGLLRVGFAMGGAEVVDQARDKLKAKELDLIVANAIDEEGAGFGGETNRVTVLAPQGAEQRWPLLSKGEVAEAILDCLLRLRAGAGAFSP